MESHAASESSNYGSELAGHLGSLLGKHFPMQVRINRRHRRKAVACGFKNVHGDRQNRWLILMRGLVADDVMVLQRIDEHTDENGLLARNFGIFRHGTPARTCYEWCEKQLADRALLERRLQRVLRKSPALPAKDPLW